MTANRAHRARRKAVADAVAGALASLISLWVFYPVDVYKTRVQGSTTSGPLSSSSLLGVVSSWTWNDCWAGWKMKTVHTSASSFCYFFIYSWIYSLWKKRMQMKHQKRTGSSAISITISSSTRLVLSAVAAMLNTCLTLPLDVVSSMEQASHPPQVPNHREIIGHESDSEDYPSDYSYNTDDENDSSEDAGSEEKPYPPTVSVPGCLSKFSHLWKGLIPSLLLCLNPAINFTAFDALKNRWLRRPTSLSARSKQLTMVEAFVLGLFAKFVATITTYPLIRVKVLLMIGQESHSKLVRTKPQSSLWTCLMDEYQQRGIRHGWYQGCDLQLWHTLLKSALLMAVRERVTQVSRQWLLH